MADAATTRAASKRVRPRTGYVMVELDADDRSELEAIRDEIEADFGAKGIGLAGAVRWLIRNHRKSRRTGGKNPAPES